MYKPELSDLELLHARVEARSTTTPAPLPTIETPRLRLEAMSTRFLAAALHADPDKLQLEADFRLPPDPSLFTKLRSVERRLRLILEDASQHPWMYRAVVRKADGLMVGFTSFHNKYPDADLRRHGVDGVELAYAIEPAHRRQGYAKESVAGMMNWATREFGVSEFVATVSPDNLASLATARSLGFTPIGEQHDPVDGIEVVMRRTVEATPGSKPP